MPSIVALALGVTRANAGTLVLPEGVNPIEGSEAQAVKSEVGSIVRKEANKSTMNEKTEFTSTNGFPYTTKIRIVDPIERKYKFQIPDDHWQSLQSVGDLVDYAQKRVALEKVKPSNNVSWSTYQGQMGSQPLFVK
jgi:hypothetical protein